MAGTGRRLMGVVVGVAGGIVAALLLAPKRRTESTNGHRPTTEAADAVLEAARAAVHAARWVQERFTPSQTGLPPDERLSAQIRQELERGGIWTPRLDITTVDGTVFLRGHESDAVRAETIASIVREVPGVVDVMDEVRRE
jgi:osmotically-inducible protein OsmY